MFLLSSGDIVRSAERSWREVMPIDKLTELAAKGYVVRLDTTERVLEPEGGSQPQ